MWWLLPAALVGAGAAVVAYFSKEEREARERWQKAHHEVQQTVEEHRRHIEAHLSQAQRSFDFHSLVDLHFASQRVGDAAYAALNDARTSVKGMGRILGATKRRRNALKAMRRASRDPEEKANLTAEIDVVLELRSAVFVDWQAVKDEEAAMLAEVRRLNAQTRALKLAIRDGCGPRGRDWYERLEARTAARREQRTSRATESDGAELPQGAARNPRGAPEGRIVSAIVLSVDQDFVVLDIEGKFEGVLAAREFDEGLAVGDVVDLQVSRPTHDGLARISRWDRN